MDFDLATAFKSFDVAKNYSSEFPDVGTKIGLITSCLASNTDSISNNSELLEDVTDLVHGYRNIDSKSQKQLVYLLSSSLVTLSQEVCSNIESGDFVESIDAHKASLERYGYFVFVILTFLGIEDSAPKSSVGRKGGGDSQIRWKHNCSQVEECLNAVQQVLKIDLAKIFVTTAERDLFIDLFTRPMFYLMESPERMKNSVLRVLMFRAIARIVKSHKYLTLIQNSIIQCLMYYTHLAIYMAELLDLLANEYDYGVLSEEVLREISQLEFNSNDNNGPKSISEFLIRLSELSPRLILKEMSCVVQLLDNSNQTLRCAVIESCGNVVVDLILSELELNQNDERTDNKNQHLDSLLDLLHERTLDQNPYVRTKALQALIKVSNLPAKLTARRQLMTVLAVRSLDDKSTLVRRNSIKLMSKLLMTHPFSGVHGTQLSYDFWREKLDEALSNFEQYFTKHSSQRPKDADGMEVDEDVRRSEQDEENAQAEIEGIAVDDAEDNDEEGEKEVDLDVSFIEEEENIPDKNILIKARLTLQYYKDAVVFIEALERGTELVSKLLFSKNKNEVLESMDFLVLADAFDIRNSRNGIRQMLHLVWMKGSSEEGKSISAHLVDCYKDLFLVAPTEFTPMQKIAYIAKNLIELTFSASAADLASLEKLLCMMYENGHINQDIIRVIWQIYNMDPNEDGPFGSKEQFRGSIIILGMLAWSDHNIVLRGLDNLLNVGLGQKGQNDLVFAKYSCVALQRIIPHINKNNDTIKIDREEEAVGKLQEVLTGYTEHPEWYAVAEQAIGAIYLISSRPDDVCSDIIKKKCLRTFNNRGKDELSSVSLSQLLFVVGHVAIKTIVHLEMMEAIFKKKKLETESLKKKEISQDSKDELEMIGGTSEDDFADAVIYIREREILYGEGSLLARFGPLVKEICYNAARYNNAALQRSAVLCMAKLMCVSSKYCEDNLPLLITIMEKSPDPIIRCNCVIGLGDMAVCFNNLVDENTDFLYLRLNDDNIMVQRTCLMTVTFLILAGQVKVKGQLSSMAKCLEDRDLSISDMCRLFFTELASKDNAIYNSFIDIFSGLANDENLPKDAMKRIIKFLLNFIEREKQQKQLAEKLLARLLRSENEAQWNDVAFVLSAIPFKNEQIVQALEEGYKTIPARQ